MKLSQTGRLTGLALAGTLALAACATDGPTNTASSGASTGTGVSASTGASAAASTGAGSLNCASGSLTGAGSTAQKNAMDEWIKAYQQACQGVTINYQGVGSGAGIEQFTAGTVDFAGSDSALKSDERPKANARCVGGSALDLPMVVGPIAVAYNLPGVDNLVLDGPTLAGIFSGKISKWNDPAITALNSGTKLPSTTIQAFHRSDASGTTDNFTKYLAAAAPSAWSYGTGKQWKAPGGQGAKGSDGVTGAVKQTTGAVTYTEKSYVDNAALSAAKISTGSGSPVALSSEAAAKAVAAAQVTGTGNDLTLKLDYATKADGAYPIVLVTYEIACSKGLAADKVALLKSFLTYTSSDAGQQAISGLGYGTLPAAIQSKVQQSVAALS